MFIYTAKVYIGEQLITSKSGDNLDQLFIWMMAEIQANGADYHGKIINNQTQEVVRICRRCHDE